MESPQHQSVDSRMESKSLEGVPTSKLFESGPELQLLRNSVQRQNSYVAHFLQRKSLDSLADLCKNLNDNISWEQCVEASAEEPTNFACLCYNIAAANFHARNFDVSQRILTYLIAEWRYLSDVSCAVSWKIRLLLADTLLRQRKFTTAIAYVDQLEFLKCQLEQHAKKPTEDSYFTLLSSDKDEWICNIKSRIQLCKTSCYLACRSLKAAKRECKILFGMLGTSSQCHLGAMHLKAYQEYLRGNMTKAVNLIRNVPTNAMPKPHDLLLLSGDLQTVLAANNEGCCQFYLGRPLSAGMFFKKAIIAFDEEIPSSDEQLPLHALSCRTDSIKCLYNFGISCLHAKDSERAFHCLMSCSKHFGRNPRLWLRIAECCIQKYQLTNENIMRHTEANSTSSSEREEAKSSEKQRENDSSDGPKLSLSFGFQCIKTSLALLNSQRARNPQWVDVPPSNPLITEKDICELHASILCTGSYLCIQTEDYCTSVDYLEELLRLPYLPGLYKYLALQYLSHSFSKLNEVEKAISTFEDDSNIVDLTISLSSGEVAEDTIESSPAASISQTQDSSFAKRPLLAWHPSDEWTARMIQVYNRACLLVKIGKFEEAEEILEVWTAATNSNLPPDFLTLAAFVYSKLENIPKATGLLHRRYTAALTA